MVGEYCVSGKLDLYLLKTILNDNFACSNNKKISYIHILGITCRWVSIRKELFSVMENKLWYLMGKVECYQIYIDS